MGSLFLTVSYLSYASLLLKNECVFMLSDAIQITTLDVFVVAN